MWREQAVRPGTLDLAIAIVSLARKFSSVGQTGRTIARALGDRLARLVESLRGRAIPFHAICDAAPDAIVVTRDGRIVWINPRCSELFGYTSAELVDQAMETLLPERFRARHRDLRAQWESAPVARLMGAAAVVVAKRKDDIEFPVEINLTPVTDADGLLVTTVVRDRTAQEQVEKAHRASDEKYRILVE